MGDGTRSGGRSKGAGGTSSGRGGVFTCAVGRGVATCSMGWETGELDRGRRGSGRPVDEIGSARDNAPAGRGAAIDAMEASPCGCRDPLPLRRREGGTHGWRRIGRRDEGRRYSGIGEGGEDEEEDPVEEDVLSSSGSAGALLVRVRRLAWWERLRARERERAVEEYGGFFFRRGFGEAARGVAVSATAGAHGRGEGNAASAASEGGGRRGSRGDAPDAK